MSSQSNATDQVDADQQRIELPEDFSRWLECFRIAAERGDIDEAILKVFGDTKAAKKKLDKVEGWVADQSDAAQIHKSIPKVQIVTGFINDPFLSIKTEDHKVEDWMHANEIPIAKGLVQLLGQEFNEQRRVFRKQLATKLFKTAKFRLRIKEQREEAYGSDAQQFIETVCREYIGKYDATMEIPKVLLTHAREVLILASRATSQQEAEKAGNYGINELMTLVYNLVPGDQDDAVLIDEDNADIANADNEDEVPLYRRRNQDSNHSADINDDQSNHENDGEASAVDNNEDDYLFGHDDDDNEDNDRDKDSDQEEEEQDHEDEGDGCDSEREIPPVASSSTKAKSVQPTPKALVCKVVATPKASTQDVSKSAAGQEKQSNSKVSLSSTKNSSQPETRAPAPKASTTLKDTSSKASAKVTQQPKPKLDATPKASSNKTSKDVSNPKAPTSNKASSNASKDKSKSASLPPLAVLQASGQTKQSKASSKAQSATATDAQSCATKRKSDDANDDEHALEPAKKKLKVVQQTYSKKTTKSSDKNNTNSVFRFEDND